MQRLVSIDNKRVEINIYGDKKVSIVLLAGWTHDFKYETKFINELKKIYKVVTISYPGYSDSNENSKSQSMKYIGYIVSQIINKLGLTNVKILGFSMGCQVALNYFKYFNPKAEIILFSPPLKPLIEHTPLYGKLVLSSKIILKFVREIKIFKKFLINQAYQNIYQITEGVNKKIYFKESKVSLNGAFDTLIANLTSFINPLRYKNKIKFIFGEKEILQNGFEFEYKIIKNSGHGEFKTKYKEIVKLI